MATKDSKPKRRYRAASPKKRSAHRKKREIHVVPDLFGVAGVLPIINGNASGSTPYEQYKGGAGVSGVMGALEANAISPTQLKEAAVLEIIGYAAKVVGKKLGLNTIGTKGVKLF
jgi:hypothetical protein